MNRTTKIILGIIAGLVVVCSACAVAGILLFSISSRTVGRSIQSSSANVAQASADIAEYDLPARSEEQAIIQKAKDEGIYDKLEEIAKHYRELNKAFK